MTGTKDLPKSLLWSNNIIWYLSNYSIFLHFLILPNKIHDINKIKAITKLSSFFWYNFHVLHNDIPVKIINFLHLKLLSNQIYVRLWSMFNCFLYTLFIIEMSRTSEIQKTAFNCSSDNFCKFLIKIYRKFTNESDSF